MKEQLFVTNGCTSCRKSQLIGKEGIFCDNKSRRGCVLLCRHEDVMDVEYMATGLAADRIRYFQRNLNVLAFRKLQILFTGPIRSMYLQHGLVHGSPVVRSKRSKEILPPVGQRATCM